MKYIVPVISGKGGVGKSTVAVNVAIALATAGKSVALIDGDFYGPSIPVLLGGGDVAADVNGRIIPPVKFGLRYISIGFFLENQDDPVIWRGPMFNKALGQMFNDVEWGDSEYYIVDMPPGTGDAPLSLAQMMEVSGAIVVTTPQEVALADVRKAVNMLRKVDVPVLGIVENMAGFIAPDGSRHEIFGSGGGEKLAQAFDVPLLASIPIDPLIREGGDSAEPVVCTNSPVAAAFREVADKVVDALEKLPKKKAALKILN